TSAAVMVMTPSPEAAEQRSLPGDAAGESEPDFGFGFSRCRKVAGFSIIFFTFVVWRQARNMLISYVPSSTGSTL
ncbi:MAG: hypothetical protein MJY51_05070, partial [Bacteroidales bacterium]|nr:hypothetical protein [Bacteroidales bacterium]